MATATVAVLAWAPTAPAQTDADRLFDEGVAAFERGEYQAALEAFEASYAIDPAPDALLNIGMCQRLVGQNARAVNALRRYLAGIGAAIPPEELASIRQQIEEIAPAIGQIVVEVSEPGASVLVDGEEIGVSPLGWVVAVEPGRHSVVARKEGFEAAASSVGVAAGSAVAVTLVLRPAPSPAPAEPRSGQDSGGLGWWFWGSVIAAGTLGAGMAVTGGLALRYRDQWEDSDRWDFETRETGLALRTTTDVLLGLACGAVFSAILAVFLEDGESDQAPPNGVTALAAPGGIAFAW